MKSEPSQVPWTLGQLLDKALPLNRKEQFYTGTVLPGLVGGDDFAHLGLLGDLVGAPGLDIRIERGDCTVVFFTEYGIAESAVGEAKERFKGLPTGRDTPDVVILVTEPRPVLIAIEAKMYWRPGGTALLKQLDAQADLLRPLCERLAEWLGVPEVELKHVLLLPKAQAETHVPFPYPIITWQDLRAAFARVAPHYWLAMLDEALDRYEELVSKPIAYDAESMTGAEIRDCFLAEDRTFQAMGRKAASRVACSRPTSRTAHGESFHTKSLSTNRQPTTTGSLSPTSSNGCPKLDNWARTHSPTLRWRSNRRDMS